MVTCERCLPPYLQLKISSQLLCGLGMLGPKTLIMIT